MMLKPLQILTGVYLAGVLLPCLVTALTIARKQSVRFAVGLMARCCDRRDRFFDASGLGRRSFCSDLLKVKKIAPSHKSDVEFTNS